MVDLVTTIFKGEIYEELITLPPRIINHCRLLPSLLYVAKIRGKFSMLISIIPRDLLSGSLCDI